MFHWSKLIEVQRHQMKARNPVSGISSSVHAMNMDKECLYTDEELIARFQDGDEQAYVELVYRYRDRLITFVFGYFKDIGKAEDLVLPVQIYRQNMMHSLISLCHCTQLQM